MGRLIALLRELNPEETLEQTVLVLMYEVGDLAKCVRKLPEPGYTAECIKSLADIITQARLIGERLGYDLFTLKAWGELDMEDKVKEKLKCQR